MVLGLVQLAIYSRYCRKPLSHSPDRRDSHYVSLNELEDELEDDFNEIFREGADDSSRGIEMVG